MCWQNRVSNLTYAMWADNAVVKTLSNFHDPERIRNGLKRRRRVDGVREKLQSPVPCPKQQQCYSSKFHLIDQGNGNEEKYTLCGENHKHGWVPKLVFKYTNMTGNNTTQMYGCICDEHTPGYRKLTTREGMKQTAHAWRQRGDDMRTYRPEHPPPICKVTDNVFDYGTGRKLCSDAFGYAAPLGRATKVVTDLNRLCTQQKKNEWRTHQSIPHSGRGRCSFSNCPGFRSLAKRKRGNQMFHHCEECSAVKGKPVYFCNKNNKGQRRTCHMTYHQRHHSKETDNKSIGVPTLPTWGATSLVAEADDNSH